MTETIETIVDFIKNTNRHILVVDGETSAGVKFVISNSYDGVYTEGDKIILYDGDGDILSFKYSSIVARDRGDFFIDDTTVVSFV